MVACALLCRCRRRRRRHRSCFSFLDRKLCWFFLFLILCLIFSLPFLRSSAPQPAPERWRARGRESCILANCIQYGFTFGLLLFFCILFSDSSVNRIERESFSAFLSSMCATRHAALPTHNHTHTHTFANIHFCPSKLCRHKFPKQ